MRIRVPSVKAAATLSALALLITAAALHAGPLVPPSGPITSTYKTLTEVKPSVAINATNTPGDADSVYRITEPGSYYLTANIAGEVGKQGIEIATSNVSIDLCGFAAIGVVGSLHGIATSANVTGVHVRNGTISKWGGTGLHLGVTDAVATGTLVEGITSSFNTVYGIVGGSSARIINCAATNNGDRGIFVFSNSSISGCIAISNADAGIIAQSGGVISDCTAWSNAGRGISSTGSVTIRGCSAVGSGAEGIFAGSGGVIDNCTANGNTGVGITGSINVTIRGSVSYQNDTGGFSLSTGSAITACSAYDNTGNGYTIGNGSSIIACNARQNSVHGIQIAGSSSALNNNCAINGDGDNGAGILVTGSDNRIEGNNCTGADIGIHVTGAGNFIARNTCSGNTSNWDIAASNKCLVVSGANAPAFSGNSGGVSPGSTDPNANYTY